MLYGHGDRCRFISSFDGGRLVYVISIGLLVSLRYVPSVLEIWGVQCDGFLILFDAGMVLLGPGKEVSHWFPER